MAPAISTEMNHLVSPMALASRRSTGSSNGKRHALSWNTPTLSRWVSSCSAIATNTEKLPIGLYWIRTRRTRNYCPLWMRRRKKIWGATGRILSCDNWNRTSESFGSSSMSKLAEILRRLANWARKWLAVREQAILWCRSKLNRFPGQSHAPLSRINLHTKLIQRARVVLSVHTLGAQIRATATSPSDASAR